MEPRCRSLPSLPPSLFFLASSVPSLSLLCSIRHLVITDKDQEEDIDAYLFPPPPPPPPCCCRLSLSLLSSASSMSSTSSTPSSILLSQKRSMSLRHPSLPWHPWSGDGPQTLFILMWFLPPPPFVPSACGRRRMTVTLCHRLLSFSHPPCCSWCPYTVASHICICTR